MKTTFKVLAASVAIIASSAAFASGMAVVVRFATAGVVPVVQISGHQFAVLFLGRRENLQRLEVRPVAGAFVRRRTALR